MKILRLALGCFLVVALCVPATAVAEQKFSIGAQFDYTTRNLTYVNFDADGQNAAAWRNSAQYEFDYKMTNQVIGVSARWQPCDWFAVGGLFGLTGVDYRQYYVGNNANESDVRLKDDYNDPLYGVTLEFILPVSDSISVGATGTGRFAYYRNCGVRTDAGMFEDMEEMDMQWWDVNALAKVAYTGVDNLTIFLGPTLSLTRLEVQKKMPTKTGTIIDKLKLDEDKMWGLEGGLDINITDNFNASVNLKVINQTGVSARLAYVF